MLCGRCQSSLPETSRFCPNCGSPVAEPIGPGTVLGSYRIVRAIAEGGMGTVYLGEHTRLSRPVCIKMIQSSLAGDHDTLVRFEREASLMAGVRHPNVVSVLDLGQLPAGGLYLVLEFVDGQNLRDLLRTGPMPLPRALEITRQVLVALEEVHQHGIVHRDLKPSNILVRTLRDGSDVVQLADFGIAKQVSDPALSDSGLTKSGVVVGTPGYVAPEQILGDAFDGRVDLYAVGTLLHELVAGQRLFAAESGVELMRKHLLETPPPALPSEPNNPLNGFIARALAKSPDERFLNAKEMRLALAALKNAPAPARPSVPPKPSAPMQSVTVATAPRPVNAPPPTAASEFAALIAAWKATAPAERTELGRQLEARFAAWLGQGTPEPLVRALETIRSERTPELEALVRSFLVDRIGAVVRVLASKPAELKVALALAGAEGNERLMNSLRSTEVLELANSIAPAVLMGPLRGVVDRLPTFKAVGVGALVSVSASLPFANVRPLLVLAVNHTDAAARAAALKNLSTEQGLQLVAEVRKRLSDRDAAVRSAATRLVGSFEDRASVPALLQLLKRAEVLLPERQGLIAALGEIGGPEVANALRTELGAEKVLEVRCALADALGKIGDAASLELLRREGGRMLAPAAFKAVCAKYT